MTESCCDAATHVGERTRAHVLDAAAELFAAKGFVDTRVNEIAAAARVSKPLLYRLFRGKQAIYCAILEREEAFLTHMVLAPVSQDHVGDLGLISARILARFWRLQARRPTALPLLLGSLDWRVEKKRKDAVRREIEGRIEGIVERCLPSSTAARTYALLLLAFALSTAGLIHTGQADRSEMRAIARNGIDLLRRLGREPQATPTD